MNPTVAKMAAQIALSLVRSRTGRRLLIGVLVLQLIALTVILWLPSYFASITASSVQRVVITAPASNCGTETTEAVADDGSPLPRVKDLTPKQVKVARTIYHTTRGVGKSLGWSADKTERAFLVALATAKQESQLGAYPGYERPDEHGDAGVFQQRQKLTWYGTLEQVNQVGYAASVFLRGRKVPAAEVAAARRAGYPERDINPAGYTIPGLKKFDFENMSVTEAAQEVQRSAFGLAYAKHERIARTLLSVFKENLDTQSAEAQVIGESTLCGPTEAATCTPTGRGAESGLKPDALRVLRCTAKSWPEIRTFGGLGQRAGPSDHPSGRAVDIMIPDFRSPAGVAKGDEIARWQVANRKKLGVKYVIWREKIWSESYPSAGWQPYCNGRRRCDDASSRHLDHVHVSVYGDSAGEDVVGGPGASDRTESSGGRPVLPLTRVALTARFGQCSGLWARCHTGLDFSAGVGTPIRAVLGGRVVSSGWAGAYGQLTKIESRSGVVFYYAHQSARGVRTGQEVRTGQVIGRVGATGNVTGPHLHLEVRERGSAVDPEKWLEKQGLRLG